MSVVETTTFRLVAGTKEDEFLASDRRVQNELVPNQPGFMRRTTARRGEEWLVVTLWYSEQNAFDCAAVATGHPVQLEFESHIEPGSITTSRYETLD
jgi:hypothetical protein